MPKLYAGIGSRQTPEPILDQMTVLATRLRIKGYWLRSGGAIGADRAFEDGACHRATIYRAKDATPEAYELAAKYHPAWDKLDAQGLPVLSEYAKALHARNGMIVLGRELNDPVDFIVCWTQAGLTGGGTGQALRIAYDLGIPVFNLYSADAAERVLHFINGGDTHGNATG